MNPEIQILRATIDGAMASGALFDANVIIANESAEGFITGNGPSMFADAMTQGRVFLDDGSGEVAGIFALDSDRVDFVSIRFGEGSTMSGEEPVP